jgi:hypothetical protein
VIALRRLNRQGLVAAVHSSKSEFPFYCDFLLCNGSSSGEEMNHLTMGSAANIIACSSQSAVLKQLAEKVRCSSELSSTSSSARRRRYLCVADTDDSGVSLDLKDSLNCIRDSFATLNPLESSFGHSLVLVAMQRPVQPVLDLQKTRRACSQPMATKPWTSEQEQHLRDLISRTNCCRVFMGVL